MTNKKTALFQYAGAAGIILLMTAVSVFLEDKEIIFPEIAALVTGFFLSKKCPWHTGSVKFVLLMTLSAVFGTILTAWLPVHEIFKVLLCFCFAAVCLTFSKSDLFPMVSACILPVLMHTTSFIYPLSVFLLTVLIVCLNALFIKTGVKQKEPLGSVQSQSVWFWLFAGICLFIYGIYPICSGRYLLIAPPLIVMFLELFSNEIKLRGREISVGAVTAVCAGIGAFSRYFLCIVWGQNALISCILTTVLVFLVFYVMNLPFPPAAALAFLPLIIEPELLLWYPLWILVTSGIITAGILILRHVRQTGIVSESEKDTGS